MLPVLPTPEIIAKAAPYIRRGWRADRALMRVGISKHSTNLWLSKASAPQPEPEFQPLAEEFDRAEAEWGGKLEERIASDPDWRGPARALEAREIGSWRRDQLIVPVDTTAAHWLNYLVAKTDELPAPAEEPLALSAGDVDEISDRRDENERPEWEAARASKAARRAANRQRARNPAPARGRRAAAN